MGVMTPVVRKRLSQIEVLSRKEQQGSQDLIFSSRPFVLCGLPLRRPSKGTVLHTRRNGKFILQVQAHPDFGLPFGQDRLIPIWVATLALRQQSRCVRFRSGSEMLDEFGLPRNGTYYRRLIDGFKRLHKHNFVGPSKRPKIPEKRHSCPPTKVVSSDARLQNTHIQ